MLHERITIDPKVMFGKPVITGTRVPVELILRKIGEGMTDGQILQHHPHLTIEDIHAAAAFAADHLAAEEIVPALGSPPRQRVTLVVQVPEPTEVWPENVADIYREIADDDRRLSAAMFPTVRETWPTSEGQSSALPPHPFRAEATFTG